MLPTPGQRCLIRAATGDPASVQPSLAEWRSLVDLTGPIDGGSYRLIPAVYHRLQALDLDDPHREMFKGVYRRSMVDVTRTVDAVTPALGVLHGAGLDLWVSKGAALVRAGYYPTFASRPMTDVDVVVDASRRVEAVGALHSLGYTPRFPEAQMGHVHATSFVSRTGHQLDLHWHHLKDARSTEADALLTRSWSAVDLNGVPVRVAGPTGQLIVALVHGMVANREPTIRWLVDAAMVLDRDGELVVWDDVVTFARQFRLARRLREALEVLAATTGRAVPSDAGDAIAALPFSLAERLEARCVVVGPDSAQGRGLRLLSGYSGGDRAFRRVVTGLPTYAAMAWDVPMWRLPGRLLHHLLRSLRHRPRA